MGDVSMNNEVIMRAPLSASTVQCLPLSLITSANIASKPLSSMKRMPISACPPLAHITNTKKNGSNLGYAKSPPTVADEDSGMIALEHCYARPLNWKPDSSFYQPTKLLFMHQHFSKNKSLHPLTNQELESDPDVNIDVDSVPPAAIELYDKAKATHLMAECDRHVEITKVYQTDDDWEESIIKTNWTNIQFKLFNGMASILNNDMLARLANVDTHHEPIQRRVLIDKSVHRVRHLFSTISWDTRLTQWIHQLLLDHLSPPYLSAYLDILQTLKSKLPGFVDKMLFGPSSNSRIGPSSIENLFQLIKRPWDPFSSYLAQNKLRKLPGNPVIIIVPSAPSTLNITQFKRQLKWMNLLANLSTVVAVHTNIGSNASRLTMINCADQMLTATRAKVQEVKAEYSGRTIILVGFNAGAALALQVAQVESVFCVVCMGFSVLTVEGKRGEPDDSLLELQCPVLFVIGQCSNTSSQEDMEDLRERMRVENGLIVVGSADDNLRVKKKLKRAEGITQTAVDRLIVESVGEFISSLMLSPYPPQHRQSPTQVAHELQSSKRYKIERARNNSNGSSLESEPPSPTPRITRPVGRPPGSKSKNKLEAKWVTQVAQGTLPTPSPPPPLTQPISKPLANTCSVSSPLIPTVPISVPDNNDTKILNTVALIDNSNKESSVEHISDNSSNKVESGNTTISNTIPTASKVYTPPVTRPTPGIKVLESVTFNTTINGKPAQNSKPSINLSKITLLNSGNPSTTRNLTNMIVMPDGKIRTVSSAVKGTSVTPLLLPLPPKNKTAIQTVKHGTSKYITSKKQLLGQRPPYMSQKPTVVTSFAPTLPPPTNLTTQDIMDLPIIFADDNQMLTDSAELQKADVPVSEILQPIQPPKLQISNPVGKFVFLNKQQQQQQHPLLQSLTTQTLLKRPTLSVPVRTTVNPVKYTKIIISRGLTTETKTIPPTTGTVAKITHLSPEISIRRIEASVASSSSTPEPIDLENKLVATAIPKPEYTITIKKEPGIEIMPKFEKSIEILKRNAMAAKFGNTDNDDDPDYVPPKSVKLK